MKVALELAPGLVSDETLYSTPGRWADGSNVRFRLGKPETVGGWEKYNATLIAGVCRSALAWTDSLSQPNVAFGTNTSLNVIKSGEWYDITPAGIGTGAIDAVYYDGGWGGGGWGMGAWGVGQTEEQPRVWSLANWGEALIAAPAGGAPYYWGNDPSQVATVISQAPQACNRILVTPERQLLAFGCEEELSGLFNPMCIRGSDIEDYTDWTTASNNNAFEHILEGGGMIVDAKMLGSLVLVWTDSGLFVGEFLGQPDQAYRFDRVADGCGLISPQASVVDNQTAYWMTPDLRFFFYQYGGIPTEIPCPIGREFRDNLDTAQVGKIVATSIQKFGEIWWFYPDARDGDENSRYIALNVTDQTLPWFKGDIARTAFIDSGPLAYPLGVSYAGQTYLHENGAAADGAALVSYIESSAQYLGEGDRRLLLKGIWPDFEAQQGDITLSIDVRERPQSSASTKGPWTLATTTLKKDFLASGRLVSVKFAASAVGSFYRIGKPAFETVSLGGE